MTTQSSPSRDGEQCDSLIRTKTVKAGHRTYFFDVRATRADDYFLTITEVRKILSPSGAVAFDRHKLFLFKEDFDKFADALTEAVDFIRHSRPEVAQEVGG